MIQSVSSSQVVSAISRPQLPQDAKVEAIALTTQKSGSDSAEFTSAALKLLASNAEGD